MYQLCINRSVLYRAVIVIAWIASLAARSEAMEQVTFHRGEKTLEVEGRMLVEAKDGGLLLLGRDGVIWAVQPNELLQRKSDERPFQPFSREEVSKLVSAGLPQGFRVHHTTHYLIFYDTTSAYAQWCGSLFERLYMAFTNFWVRKGFELSSPEFPLVAIVFADRNAYLNFSRPELGEAGETIVGYYGLMSNRITMYDLTGIESQGQRPPHGRTTAWINHVLSQPNALRTVATIVHEATHQIAFNVGLHTRLSDCPLWVSEGIAVFFETPDLSSTKGWSGLGAVNRPRFERFQQYLAQRPTDSLETLLRNDSRFRDPQQSLDAYAEAWALTYFLLHQRQKQYCAYLARLRQKTPLVEEGEAARLEEFRREFGDLKALDAEFLRYISRLR